MARTRPECIELAPTVHVFAGHHVLEAIVVNSGQHADKHAPVGAGHAAQRIVAMRADIMSAAAAA